MRGIELKRTVRESHAKLSTMLLSNETSPNSTKKQANETAGTKCQLPDTRDDPVILFLVLDICIHPIILPELQDSEDDLMRLAS
jgi:hypothetical protein